MLRNLRSPASSTRRQRIATRRPIVSIIAALAMAALLVSSATAGTPKPRATAGGACIDPITRDLYDGFQIGVPAGWNLLTLGNLLVVSRDLPQVEAAVVYPVVLGPGESVTRVFNAAMDQLQQDAAANGGSLSVRGTGSPGGLPQAALQGRGGGLPVSGRAGVSILSDQTANGSKLAVVSAYWAPAASLHADGAALASVGSCFRPGRGTPFLVVRDPFFTYSIAPRWRVASESQDGIDIFAPGNKAGANYFEAGVPASSGVHSAATLLSLYFRTIGVNITRTLLTVRLPTAVAQNGGLNSSEYVEFTGTFQREAIHGIVSVFAVSGSVGTVGVLRYGLAQAQVWNADNGALRRMIGGIQHNFTADLQEWEHLNQQWQTFDQQEQSFDDIINGSQLAVDPTTGRQYDVPPTAYTPNGPSGPGYYDPTGSHKLNPVTSAG
jgi:hypothetical protein